MSHRTIAVALLSWSLVACASPTKVIKDPNKGGDQLPDLTVPGKTFRVTGVLTAPPGMASTKEYFSTVRSFSEGPLPAQTVYLADAGLKPLNGGPTAKTDAQGRFTLDSPQRAGFVLSKPASASAPLAAYYREGTPASISVASTLVAGKLARDMASKSVSILALDPAKIQAATQLVSKELVSGTLKPDFSMASWTYGMVDYAYRFQGEFAKSFNAIIPGSVGPKMSQK